MGRLATLYLSRQRSVRDWVLLLREQAQQIGKGNYQPNPELFTGAPEDIILLNGDLNILALEMRERDRLQLALTHEVHHRVKNNLQIVTSLLSMQASKIADPLGRAALGQTRARMGALALIHRMLYEQTDDSTQGQIDIARLMNELCAQLRLMHHDATHVDFSCAADAHSVPLDSTVPLILFAVEAVTNAYRHAFPEGRAGKLTMQFGVVDGHAQLRVTDDGIGHDATGDFTSMGRQLMNAFAHQLGGKLEIVSAPETGTIISLTYPIGAAA